MKEQRKMNNGKWKMKNIRKFMFLKLSLTALLILAFVSAGFAQEAAPKQASLKDQAALVSEFDVNGLKVLVKRRSNMATVSAGLFIRGGARNITAKNAGIEGFMLEVASEGSKKYPREVLRRELSGTGGGIGAGGNSDFHAISLATTLTNFDRSWDIFTDVIMNPTFKKDDIERVRTRILTGLRERETDADNFLTVLQDRTIYKGHPYENDAGGTPEIIGSFTDKDLKAFHKKIMQTSQLLLVIVGDVDAAEIQKKVAATLGKLPRGEYKETKFPALDFKEATLNVTERPLPTNYVKGIFTAPAIDNPDYYAMRIATAILQGRIFYEVRDRRQLSYAPNAELDSWAVNTGNIYVTAVDANQAVKVMLDEIEQMKTTTIPSDRLPAIASNFLTIHYIDQETNGAQVRELAQYELIGGGWRNAFNFLEGIRSVTPQQIRDVSKKYMRNLQFIVVGDPAAIDKKVFLQIEDDAGSKTMPE